MVIRFLGDEDDGTTGLADLLLSLLADPAGLDDAGGLEATVTEELGVSVGKEVDDGDGTTLLGLVGLLLLDELGHVGQVHGGLPGGVGLLVEVTHTELTEVSGMVLIHVDAVVVLSSGVTASRGMLLVLTDTSVTIEGGTALVTALLEAGGHVNF